MAIVCRKSSSEHQHTAPTIDSHRSGCLPVAQSHPPSAGASSPSSSRSRAGRRTCRQKIKGGTPGRGLGQLWLWPAARKQSRAGILLRQLQHMLLLQA